MSVHRDRDSWRVFWKVNGKQRSRSFKRKTDAELFDADLTRKRLLGADLAAELHRSALTLDDFVRTGFRTHAATLAKPTRDKYVWALEVHLTELADEPLRALDVPRLAAHQELMLKGGATPNTVREVMTKLSGILQIATEHGLIPGNPVRSLRKVPADQIDDIVPLAPEQLERLILGATGRARAIMLLAGHLGLRPIEVRLVPWNDFHGDTLTVGRSRTKRTAAKTRTIAVPNITAHELKAWRLESGGRGDQPIIGPMTPNAMRLWNRRNLPDGVTLYTLRHSHASALHYAGFTVPEAAERLGHDEVTHVKHYAHVIRALTGTRYDGLDALLEASQKTGRVTRGLRKTDSGDES